MTNPTPRWKHVTQIHRTAAAESGWNDCAEASMARALLEYDPATPERMANPEWALVRDVLKIGTPITPMDLVNRLSLIARGHADQPTNAPTTAAGIQAMLTAFGLWSKTQYVDQTNGSGKAYSAAYNTVLSLCWVDGTATQPASFPASFFGGERGYDHIILWLPAFRGLDNLFNDPLTIYPDTATDVQYDLAGLNRAMGGAWLLPTPELLSPTPTSVTTAAVGLKVAPNHLCSKSADLARGTVVTQTGHFSGAWCEVTVPPPTGSKARPQTGWLLSANIAAQ